MDSNREVIDRFYRAVKNRDVHELREVLDPAMVIHLTAGLADSFGEGRHQDREAWLSACETTGASESRCWFRGSCSVPGGRRGRGWCLLAQWGVMGGGPAACPGRLARPVAAGARAVAW